MATVTPAGISSRAVMPHGTIFARPLRPSAKAARRLAQNRVATAARRPSRGP
jgi:hypothetical protein